MIFFLGGKGQAGETLQCLQPHPGSWGSAGGSPFWGSTARGAAAFRREPSEGAAAAVAGALHPGGAPRPPQSAATHRDLCGTRAIDVLCAWGQLNGSSVISLSRG